MAASLPNNTDHQGSVKSSRDKSPLEISAQESLEQTRTDFVEFWSEMAHAWGINRSMAQIHALLYLHPESMTTDQIMEALCISRGTANMNLHELIHWGLIQKVNKEGDRKDHYVAEADVWEIVSCIVRNRQEREIAPVQHKMRELLDDYHVDPSLNASEEVHQRMKNVLEFIEMFERFSTAITPYIKGKHQQYLKTLVRVAEAGQALRGKPE